MENLKELKKEIELIKERNKKVKADKAWETSKCRIFSIVVITYVLVAIIFYFIGVKNFLLSALIPTLGYYLSIQSLPFIKKFWIEKVYKK